MKGMYVFLENLVEERIIFVMHVDYGFFLLLQDFEHLKVFRLFCCLRAAAQIWVKVACCS